MIATLHRTNVRSPGPHEFGGRGWGRADGRAPSFWSDSNLRRCCNYFLVTDCAIIVTSQGARHQIGVCEVLVYSRFGIFEIVCHPRGTMMPCPATTSTTRTPTSTPRESWANRPGPILARQQTLRWHGLNRSKRSMSGPCGCSERRSRRGLRLHRVMGSMPPRNVAGAWRWLCLACVDRSRSNQMHVRDIRNFWQPNNIGNGQPCAPASWH